MISKRLAKVKKQFEERLASFLRGFAIDSEVNLSFEEGDQILRLTLKWKLPCIDAQPKCELDAKGTYPIYTFDDKHLERFTLVQEYHSELLKMVRYPSILIQHLKIAVMDQIIERSDKHDKKTV